MLPHVLHVAVGSGVCAHTATGGSCGCGRRGLSGWQRIKTVLVGVWPGAGVQDSAHDPSWTDGAAGMSWACQGSFEQKGLRMCELLNKHQYFFPSSPPNGT